MKTKAGKFFECAVRYDKLTEEGAVKKVTETYCVEADKFADAEERITEEISPYVDGDFEIKKIAPASYGTLFINENAGSGAAFFRAKLEFIMIDENTMKEKKTTVSYLVLAENFADSLRTIEAVMKSSTIEAVMKSSMIDYVTAQIKQSGIVELFEKVDKDGD